MNSSKVGKLIADLRKKNEMTQVDLANKLNISDKTVSKWESGNGYPDISQLPKLAKLFNITVDELLAGEVSEQMANSSLLESAVRIGGLSGVKELIAKGGKITNPDELNKNIIDYAIKYQDVELVLFLFDKAILKIVDHQILTPLEKNTINVRQHYPNGVKPSPFYSRSDEITELLILGKQYDMVKDILYKENRRILRSLMDLPENRMFVKPKSPVHKRISVILRRHRIKFSKGFLEKWLQDFDSEMVSILCGFDVDLADSTYKEIADIIGEYGKEEHKIQFLQMVNVYNLEQVIHNENAKKTYYYELEMGFAVYLPWMIDEAMDDEENIKNIISWSSPISINEDQFTKIAKKYGTDVFSNRYVQYIIPYELRNTKKAESVDYISSLYSKSSFEKFPILETIKLSASKSELEDDIILYCHMNDRSYLYKSRDKYTTYTLNDVVHEGNPRLKKICDFYIDRIKPIREIEDTYLVKQAADILEQIIISCSNRVLDEVILCFSTPIQTSVFNRFIEQENVAASRRFLEHPDTEANWEKAAIENIAKRREYLLQIGDLLNEGVLDELLNHHCADDDFELMKMLIDHGAMFLTEYSENKTDGWDEPYTALVVKRDPKRTAIMRAMLKKV